MIRFKRFGLAAFVAAAFPLAALANPAATMTPDHKLFHVTPPSAAVSSVIAPLPQTLGPKTIFSNLATLDPKGLYFSVIAYSVQGPLFNNQGQIWTAAAFTPSSNATVTSIAVGVHYIGSTGSPGVDGIVLNLFDDARGVPGRLLRSWDLRNLEPNGCCALAVGTDKAGIPVLRGKRYWVALTTTSQELYTGLEWTWNTADTLDGIPAAVNTGRTWAPYGDGIFNPEPAFGVFGR